MTNRKLQNKSPAVDASPGPARKCLHDDAAVNRRKLSEKIRTPQRKDAGRSPARIRCT